MQYRNANQNEFIFFRESSPKDNKPTEQNGSIPISSIEEVKSCVSPHIFSLNLQKMYSSTVTKFEESYTLFFGVVVTLFELEKAINLIYSGRRGLNVNKL